MVHPQYHDGGKGDEVTEEGGEQVVQERLNISTGMERLFGNFKLQYQYGHNDGQDGIHKGFKAVLFGFLGELFKHIRIKIIFSFYFLKIFSIA